MEKKKTLIIVGFVVSICLIGLSAYKIIDISNKVSKDKNGEVLNKTKVKGDLEEEKLNDEIEKLKDPEYIAKYARENFSYSENGEYIIKTNNEGSINDS